MWWFPARHGGTPLSLDGLFGRETHLEMDDLGVPPILGHPHMGSPKRLIMGVNPLGTALTD